MLANQKVWRHATPDGTQSTDRLARLSRQGPRLGLQREEAYNSPNPSIRPLSREWAAIRTAQSFFFCSPLLPTQVRRLVEATSRSYSSADFRHRSPVHAQYQCKAFGDDACVRNSTKSTSLSSTILAVHQPHHLPGNAKWCFNYI